MKKSTKQLLTLGAVLVGGYLVWKAFQPLRLYQLYSPSYDANPQARTHVRVF